MPRQKKVLSIEETVEKIMELVNNLATQGMQWRYVRESATMGRVNMPGEASMNKPTKKKVRIYPKSEIGVTKTILDTQGGIES